MRILIKNTISNIRQSLGIEMLEYEDKNLLSGDNESRCRCKQNLLRESLDILQDLEKEIVSREVEREK